MAYPPFPVAIAFHKIKRVKVAHFLERSPLQNTSEEKLNEVEEQSHKLTAVEYLFCSRWGVNSLVEFSKLLI